MLRRTEHRRARGKEKRRKNESGAKTYSSMQAVYKEGFWNFLSPPQDPALDI